MIKSVLIVVLSILALSSAQLAGAPQRARTNDNTNVAQSSSSKNQDSTFGRKTSNLRHNGMGKPRNLEMSLSMPDGNESTEGGEAVPEEAAYCQGSDDECVGERTCSCRFNCLFCSDVPMYHVPSFCGMCVDPSE